MKWLLSSILVGLAVAQASPELPPVNRVPVAERLWLTTIAGWSSDPFAEVYAQLFKVCGDSGQQWGPNAAAYLACQAKNIKLARYRVATMHAAPSVTSPVVASIYIETISATDGRIAVMNVDRASHPGERLPWPDSEQIGDYGLNVSGVQRRGDWIRLLTSIPADGWIRVVPDHGAEPPLAIRAHVNTLTYTIVDMSQMQATWPDGRSALTEQGSYKIQKVDGPFIEFRAEIPSDFACGDPVTDPVPLPPILRAHISELFNRDGSPRFATKYTKGC